MAKQQVLKELTMLIQKQDEAKLRNKEKSDTLLHIYTKLHSMLDLVDEGFNALDKAGDNDCDITSKLGCRMSWKLCELQDAMDKLWKL